MMSDKETAFPVACGAREAERGEHGQEARERVWYREVGVPAQLSS